MSNTSNTSSTTTVAARPTIRGAQVRSSVEGSVQASLMLQIYTQTVLETPTIVLPTSIDKITGTTVRQDITTHQTKAQANAKFFLATVNPLLFTTTSSVVGFSNLWTAEFPKLLGLAKNIDAPGNKDLFARGIANLIAAANAKQQTVPPVLDALTKFSALIVADHAAFAADALIVQRAFDGTNGEIQKLKDQIATDNASRAGYIGTIVGGVITDLGAVVLIVVGALATIATAGLAVALVVGGAALVAGGTAAWISASVQLGQLDERVASESKQLAEDEVIFAAVQQASVNVDALVEATAKGVDAVSSLQTAWQSVSDDLTLVQHELDNANPDTGDWLQTVLFGADDQWKAALSVAIGLQRFGNVPTRSVSYENKSEAPS